MSERKERCETCRFWERQQSGDRYDKYDDGCMSDEEDDKFLVGACLRFPPVISDRQLAETLNAPLYRLAHFGSSLPVSVIQSASISPVTWEFDWCGEWQPMETGK